MFSFVRQVRPLVFAVCVLLAFVIFSSGSQLFAQAGERPESSEIDKSRADTLELMAAMEADFAKTGVQPQERMPATPCVGGMAGPYACDNVDMLSLVPLATFDASRTNDVWGWTDPLDGKEYVLVGLFNGTGFVDISDPENPIYLGKLPTQAGGTTWRDIKVYNNYAFVVSEETGHGMQIFDLTELRNVANPPVTFANTVHYTEFGDAHNIAINEDSAYAYAVGTNTCSGGLHMIDIQDPLNPVNAGCFSGDGYTHDAQCVNYAGPDPDYAGAEICLNSNTDTLTIVDVTNKANPVQVARVGYSGVGYTHQGWFLEDQRYFLLGDEQDESNNGHNTRTYIWDLLDLDNPLLMGNYTGPNASIDHNMYVLGDFVFQSNYSSGLQILDVTDVANTNLTMVGYFDTYVPNNSANFSGSWSNYPYFDSGVVAVTSGSEGLFVVAPTLTPDFNIQSGDPVLSICGDSSDMLTVDLAALYGYTGTVSLSTTGLPGGATPSFSPNPVMPPASSDLTVTLSGVSANDYPFDIVGTDGTLTHTLGATLHVNDAVPGTVTLTSPANGATNVDELPTLSWTAASQGSGYYLEIATDAGFSNVVYTAAVDTTSHEVTAALASETTYYWHVQSSNICGAGAFSSAFSFTTRVIPEILVVDDDDNAPDVRSYYTDVLDELALEYDVWDTGNSDNEPTFNLLTPYTMVVWFTGREFGGAAGPSGTSETELSNWLNSGSCLFISSQEYLNDRGQTAFMSNYLGVGSATPDNGNYTSLTGMGSVFSGLGTFDLFYAAPMSDWADIISPNGSAELAFEGENGNDAAVSKDNGTYKTVYFGFPFSAIEGEENRTTVLGAVAEWCGFDVVVEPTTFYSYIPAFAADSGTSSAGKPTAGVSWLLPLAGLVAAAGFGRGWRLWSKSR